MKKIVLLICCLFCYSNIFAQQFRWNATVDSIENDGYYDILLSPQITSKMSANFADIRLLDFLGKEVPYVLNTEKHALRQTLFHEYEIIAKEHQNDWDYTRIVIRNKNRKIIDNFSVIIKNADVNKWLKLNGSDDNQNWYVIKDNYFFQSFFSTNETSEIRVLNFPPVNYEYFELLISDHFDKPLNILKIGYYDEQIEEGKFSEITPIQIIQKDDSIKKVSNILVQLPNYQYFDKIVFVIEGAEQFFREASLKMADSIVNNRNEVVVNELLLKNFSLASFFDNELTFNNIYANKLILTIQNKNDKPLIIKEVKIFQLNKTIRAKLVSNTDYKLVFGNEAVTAPVYDFQFFADSLPQKLPVIGTSNVDIETSDLVIEKEKGLFNSRFIWVALIVVILLLTFMSAKMLREIKK